MTEARPRASTNRQEDNYRWKRTHASTIVKAKERLLVSVNQIGLPRLLMRSRLLVSMYFNRKYKIPNPYGVADRFHDARYEDMLSLLKDKHFESALMWGAERGSSPRCCWQTATT